MPSPFPGMDPWLEGPLFFSSIHGHLITFTIQALQERLPAPYYADSGDRVWVDYSHRYVEPDANVIRAGRPEDGAGGGTACVTRSRPTVIRAVRVANDETRERFVNIYTRQNEEERVVAVLELLSPANKAPSGPGRRLYEQKQREVLDSPTHLVEIDLLRAGDHVTAVPREQLRAAGAFDYHVCVNGSDRREGFSVYLFRMQDRLPEIAVPLLPGDGAVPLDLQTIFDRAYDVGPYRRRVRYAEPPVPPLTPDQQAWAADRLRAAGRSSLA
jgi:hypothetical protein